jgi:UDPglucose 6-dehydrogenase
MEMRIAVAGLWHLGTVTAGCLAAAGHNVIGIDEDSGLIDRLNAAELPVAEPGLQEIIQDELATGRLRFTTSFAEANHADVVWVAYDTPVDDQDRADTEFVHSRALALAAQMRPGAVLLVSSQMPVGSIARLERESASPAVRFACSPENLRLGKALQVFRTPDRVVVGVRDAETRAVLEGVWAPFSPRIEWMSVESAEMTKHAINSFLATSICFINEIATLCERTGADALEVERGLKSDLRIGPGSYLHAGGAFAGGTLARDIAFLRSISQQTATGVPLIDGVYSSNQYHKTWLPRRVAEVFPELAGTTVAILGLTYKPGTNTLRRSSAVEAAQWLHAQGARVRAFDPQIFDLPEELRSVIELAPTAEAAVEGAAALVVMTPWPEFKEINAQAAPPIVFDAARFLEPVLASRPGVRYFSIGRSI